jgi:hypothetical protein
MIVDLTLAPFAVLAFAGSAMTVVICLVVIAASRIAGNGSAAAIASKILFVGAATYTVLLLASSLTSHEQVLARGAEKHFCEVDCHIAYSVADVQRIKSPAATDGKPSSAAANYYLVTLRTRFDETTIGPHRGDGLLQPNAREVWALDDTGNRYSPLSEGAAQITTAIRSAPLTQPLRPGESYTTALLFELPANVHSPKLFVSNASWANHLLIGHENTPLHKKAYFAL